MRTLSPKYITASLLVALGATMATAQTVVGTRATGTNGSTATVSNGTTSTATTGTTSGSTVRVNPTLDNAVRAPVTAPAPSSGNTSTITSTTGNTTTVRTINADGSSVFVDNTRTLRSGDTVDNGTGVFTTRTTDANGNSVFVDNTVNQAAVNAGTTGANGAAGADTGSNTGTSLGQTSSGTTAGPSSGGLFGANASLQQNGNAGFGNNGGISLGQTSSGANIAATAQVNNGTADGVNVATNGAIIPPGGFLSGVVAAPSLGGVGIANSGNDGMSASAVDGGNMMAAGNLGSGGANLPQGSTLLDESARRENARTRAKVQRGGQMLYSVTPRTNVDRTDQMPDDNSPLMNGTRR
jgi:hypothetical protein